jgi:hypothetical protein
LACEKNPLRENRSDLGADVLALMATLAVKSSLILSAAWVISRGIGMSRGRLPVGRASGQPPLHYSDVNPRGDLLGVMKLFTRLSLGFSKKLGNLAGAVAPHVAHYNFCGIHGSLKMTRASEGGFLMRGRYDESVPQPIRQIARVAWHLNGGFTTLEWEAAGARIDVPTADIPEQLRKIGSRVVVVIHPVDRNKLNTEEELRRALRYGIEIKQPTNTKSD